MVYGNWKFFVSLLLYAFQLKANDDVVLAFQSKPYRPQREDCAKRKGHLPLSMASGPETGSPSPISFDALKQKKVLVVGGSGRVGGSVVTQLVKRGAKVTVGGTNLQSFQRSKERWQKMFEENANEISDTNFVVLNRESADSVSRVLGNDSYDLVVHTAGPFQGKVNTPNGVIDGAISNGVPYVDVCDDYCTATAAKTRFSNSQVPCIVSTGCWPGVSSLMAKQLIWKTLQADKSLQPEDLTVNFSFYTAGSGGAGATLLVATFLILAEEALIIKDGRRRPVKAMKEYSTIDFGEVIGDKSVAHLNLLETASVHDVFGAGNVQALFGTSPAFWNTLLGLMAQLPSSLLSNEEMMSKLAVFSLPIVRAVDYFAGATNAMRCDVTSTRNPNLKATAIYGHENLEPCVGECVVAFCAAVLAGRVKPGVWFPEEAITSEEDVVSVLSLASCSAHTAIATGAGVDVNNGSVWGLEQSKPLVATN